MKPAADPTVRNGRFSFVRRIVLVGVSLVLFVGSIAFGLYASGTLYHNGFDGWWPQEKPAMALKLPQVLLQAVALEDGIHLIGMQYGANNFALYFDRRTHLGNAGYHHGKTCTCCGFTVVLLTRTFDGGDYFVSPHIAVVLPYWFPPLLFAIACIWFAGGGTMMSQLRRRPATRDSAA